MLLALLTLVAPAGLAAGPEAWDPAMAGRWVFDPEASDDVDKMVAKAIRKSGGRIKLPEGVGRNDYARFRGGPQDQELYDRLAYDRVFTLRLEDKTLHLAHYEEAGSEAPFVRQIGTTRGGRVASATGSAADDRRDYSFAYWDGATLAIETRVRDGGFALERYRLLAGDRMEVFLRLEPLKFPAALEIVREFERAPADPTGAR